MSKKAPLFLYFVLGFLHFLTAQQNALDPDFSDDGIATMSVGLSPVDFARSLAIQSDDKIVVGGTMGVPDFSYDFGITRLNPDGQIDSLFGVNGIVKTDVDGKYDNLVEIGIQLDGKIVAMGHGNSTNDILLVRYNSDGSIDQNFGVQGIVKTIFPAGIVKLEALALQPDGKIILGGFSLTGQYSKTLLVRYQSSGDLDSTFGVNGKVIYDVSPSGGLVTSLAIQSDGKILTNGFNQSGPQNSPTAFINRFHPDGAIDLSFGTNGEVKPIFTATQAFDGKSIILVKPNGKIVTGAKVYYPGSGFYIGHFGIAQFNEDGSPDETFGTGGSVDLGIPGENLIFSALAVQPDGKIIASGMQFPNLTPNSNTAFFILTRFNADGSRDDSFGENGIRSTKLENFNCTGSITLALQPDGKILQLGSGQDSFNKSLVLRFLPSTSVGVHDQVANSFSAKLFPNPANQQVTLQFDLPQSGTLTVQLLDMTGRILTTVVADHAENQGAHSMDIPFPSDLPGGMYRLRILSAHGQTCMPVMHF